VIAVLRDKRKNDHVPTPAMGSVWERIEAHAGQEFHMIRGAHFHYEVTGDHVLLDRTNQKIPKSHFEKALALVPLAVTTAIQELRGPFSYMPSLWTLASVSRIGELDSDQFVALRRSPHVQLREFEPTNT
jgi:hypothetical protein